MDPSLADGKRIALVVWGTKADCSDDVVVFTGIAQWREGCLTMLREPVGTAFPIPAGWLPRLRAVDEALRETLLGAEFTISATIGNLSETESTAGIVRTCLKWPSGD
ncbi:MAG: hypothetical protein ACRD13_00165 [Terriglobales bacterium]